MRTLYIDTSSSFLYSGIINNNTIEAEVKEKFGHKLSEVALPQIVSMFDKKKLQAKIHRFCKNMLLLLRWP